MAKGFFKRKNLHLTMEVFSWQGQKDSNPQQRFWRPTCYHYTMPLLHSQQWHYMKDNILIEKSVDFGARVIKLYQYLLHSKHEFVLSKQILRSGTSIGANINEAQYGNSKADFIAKLHIALKEAAETEYWLLLLQKSNYVDERTSDSILKDCREIKRILISSINTAKSKQ